jgi:hypothetical protein
MEVEARLKRKLEQKQLKLKRKKKLAPKLQKLKSTKTDGSFSNNTTPSKDAKSQVEV